MSQWIPISQNNDLLCRMQLYFTSKNFLALAHTVQDSLPSQCSRTLSSVILAGLQLPWSWSTDSSSLWQNEDRTQDVTWTVKRWSIKRYFKMVLSPFEHNFISENVFVYRYFDFFLAGQSGKDYLNYLHYLCLSFVYNSNWNNITHFYTAEKLHSEDINHY